MKHQTHAFIAQHVWARECASRDAESMPAGSLHAGSLPAGSLPAVPGVQVILIRAHRGGIHLKDSNAWFLHSWESSTLPTESEQLRTFKYIWLPLFYGLQGSVHE